MAGRATRSARASIAEVALQMIGEAELDDLVRLLTPERLSEVGDWAPSTVRYHFGGGASEDGSRDLGFRRRELALEVVRLAAERSERTTAAAVERWNATLARMRGPEDVDLLVAAMRENLATFVPGGSEHDSTPNDRVHHLALAVADGDPEVARLLRESRAREAELWGPPVEAYIALVGRRLRHGRTIAVAYTVTDGHLTRLRIEPAAPHEAYTGLVLAALEAYTEPAPGR